MDPVQRIKNCLDQELGTLFPENPTGRLTDLLTDQVLSQLAGAIACELGITTCTWTAPKHDPAPFLTEDLNEDAAKAELERRGPLAHDRQRLIGHDQDAEEVP